jgi:hypothetical protein
MSIAINAITTAINQMVDGFLSFDAACDKVRAFRAAERLDADTARTYIQTALLAKKPEYRKQVTENGKPAQDSAFKKAVSRMMRYTDPDYSAAKDEQSVTKSGKSLTADEKALREYMAGIVAELVAQGWTKTDIKAAI